MKRMMIFIGLKIKEIGIGLGIFIGAILVGVIIFSIACMLPLYLLIRFYDISEGYAFLSILIGWALIGAIINWRNIRGWLFNNWEEAGEIAKKR